MKKLSVLLVFLLCVCGITAYAQKKAPAAKKKSAGNTSVATKSNYEKTASGLQYKVIKRGAGDGTVPELGGFMMFWFQIQNDKDSILDSQFKDPNAVGIPVPEIAFKPSIEEGFYLLREGDSAVFLLNADTLYTKTFRQTLPAYLKADSKVKMTLKVSKVYSKKFVDSVMLIQEGQMKGGLEEENAVYKKDSIAIQEYLTNHKLKGQATAGGAYVVTLRENKTANVFIASGDTVTTSYIGTLLVDGKEFDRSSPGNLFKFTVGMGMVIQGWDQGFQKLKRGEKALILIPSRLGYGTRGAGNSIPPNAPLIFEVEVQK